MISKIEAGEGGVTTDCTDYTDLKTGRKRWLSGRLNRRMESTRGFKCRATCATEQPFIKSVKICVICG